MIYPHPSVTNLNVKSAFLIIAHGNFDMLRFLIESLDDKAHDIYVHIIANWNLLHVIRM